MSPIDLLAVLAHYEPRSAEEAADVERLRLIATGNDDPWSRSTPIHATGSAIIVHPPTHRVLLRWHERMQGWLQVGGHADPGETDAFGIALREAQEETGLPDLNAWPDPDQPTLLQVTMVPVPAGRGEPAHHHADLRYLLSTHEPEAVTPESERAQLRWLHVEDALHEVTEENLRVCLFRVAQALQAEATPHPRSARLNQLPSRGEA